MPGIFTYWGTVKVMAVLKRIWHSLIPKGYHFFGGIEVRVFLWIALFQKSSDKPSRHFRLILNRMVKCFPWNWRSKSVCFFHRVNLRQTVNRQSAPLLVGIRMWKYFDRNL